MSDYNADMARKTSLLASRIFAGLLVLLAFDAAAAVPRWTDFRLKTADTNGWTFCETVRSTDRGLKLATSDAYVQTPLQAGAITSCYVVTYCSGARADTPFAVLAGTSPGRLILRDPPISYVYTRYLTNAYVFAAAADVRTVRIRANFPEEAKGNYYVTAIGLMVQGDTVEEPVPEPEVPEETCVTGGWKVSECIGGVRLEDFAWTTNVVKATPWENGVTIPGFYAYRNGTEIGSIGRDSGRATVAGLYASRAESPDGPRTLSLLGSSGSDVALELQVVNDRSDVLTGARVAFDVCQWTFPEAEPRTLSFAWAATQTMSRPAEGEWREDGQAAYVSVAAPPEGSPMVVTHRLSASGPVAVPSGGALWLRWRVARLAGSPMLGVGRVKLTLFRPHPFTMIVR